MFQNVFDEVLERDAVEDFDKPKGHPKGVLLKKFVEDINDLGVPFSVWQKATDGSLEYTSLVGAQKKILLEKLPLKKLPNYLHPETVDTVVKIWGDFKEFCDFISDLHLTNDSADIAFEKAKQWLELFYSLRDVRVGYRRARVTPYMHIMCYHVPYFVQMYGSFKKFTGQGVEKTMMTQREYYFRNQINGMLQRISF